MHTKSVDCKCLSMHLMYLKLLYEGALCYPVTKGHLLKKVQYLCAVYANKLKKKK